MIDFIFLKLKIPGRSIFKKYKWLFISLVIFTVLSTGLEMISIGAVKIKRKHKNG